MPRKKQDLNKSQMVTFVAVQNKMSVAQTERILDTFMNRIKWKVTRGAKVKIPGFGVWELKKRKARMRHNAITGEKFESPAKKYVKFRPSNWE